MKAITCLLILFGLAACSSDDRNESDIVSLDFTAGAYLAVDEYDSLSDLNFGTAPAHCGDFYVDRYNEYHINALEVFADGLVSHALAHEDGITSYGIDEPYGYIYEDFSFEFSDLALSETDYLRGLSDPQIIFSRNGFESTMTIKAFVVRTGDTAYSDYIQVSEIEFEEFNRLVSIYCR